MLCIVIAITFTEVNVKMSAHSSNFYYNWMVECLKVSLFYISYKNFLNTTVPLPCRNSTLLALFLSVAIVIVNVNCMVESLGNIQIKRRNV